MQNIDASALAAAKAKLDAAEAQREEVLLRHIANGVDIRSRSVEIDPEVVIAPGAVILAGTILKGQTVIGAGCVIGPNTLIEDSTCLLYTSDLVLVVSAEELSGIVTAEAEGHLGQVIGAEAEELSLLGDLAGSQGCTGDLDHGTDPVSYTHLSHWYYLPFFSKINDLRTVRNFSSGLFNKIIYK